MNKYLPIEYSEMRCSTSLCTVRINCITRYRNKSIRERLKKNCRYLITLLERYVGNVIGHTLAERKACQVGESRAQVYLGYND